MIEVQTVTETIHHIQGQEIEGLIFDEFGVEVDMIGEGEVSRREGFIESKVCLGDECNLVQMIESKIINMWYSSLFYTYLHLLATRGKIPAGTYRIHFN